MIQCSPDGIKNTLWLRFRKRCSMTCFDRILNRHSHNLRFIHPSTAGANVNDIWVVLWQKNSRHSCKSIPNEPIPSASLLTYHFRTMRIRSFVVFPSLDIDPCYPPAAVPRSHCWNRAPPASRHHCGCRSIESDHQGPPEGQLCSLTILHLEETKPTLMVSSFLWISPKQQLR